MSVLIEAAIFLGCAVLAVPLFSRLGLGSILGYLAAGILIGPHLMGLIGNIEVVLHVGEFGVVLLLFLIGLELNPTRLWSLRRPILLIGGGQVAVTGALIAAIAWGFGLGWPVAALVGLTLSLSSTAVASQLLSESGQLPTRHGRTALSVLLFQDIAVIPLLAAVPLLAGVGAEAGGPSPVAMVAVVIGVIVFGRFLVQPTFDLVAQWGNQDVFTAASLLLVVGTAALMEFVGLSMALGAFIAGVLFADSHHRHAVIADIEPFKGLLMGLFFIAVGMTVDLALLVERPGLVATLALGLVVGKAIILIFFGWLSRLPRRAILRFTASLAQGGEFAFVIFSAALGFNVLARETVDLMILVVAISMMLTPLLFRAAETFDRARPPDTAAAPEAPDRFAETDSPVIIAGFGRMGQIVARALRLSDTRFTALDNDLEQISFVSRFGDKAFFGDATRPHILRAAGADTAKVFVICVHDVAVSIQIAETVRSQYPDLFVIARVRNRHHAYRMLELGVHKVVRETFAGSLDIAESALVETGQSPSRAGAMVSRFKDHDEELLHEQFAIRDNEAALIASSEAAAQEFRRLMDQDGKRENE